jgi:nitrous oxidase accessory protein NosD
LPGHEACNSRSVLDFGAVGDDQNDDTEPLQAALDAAQPGGCIAIPPGRYRTRGISVRTAGLTVLGTGTIHYVGSGPALLIKAPNVTLSGVAVEGSGNSASGGQAVVVAAPGARLVRVRVSNAAQGVYADWLHGVATDLVVASCEIHDIFYAAVNFVYSGAPDSTVVNAEISNNSLHDSVNALNIDQVACVRFEDNDIFRIVGNVVNQIDRGIQSRDIRILCNHTHDLIGPPGGAEMELQGIDGLIVADNDFEISTRHAIQLSYSLGVPDVGYNRNVTIARNYFLLSGTESNSTNFYAIDVQRASNVTVTGNMIFYRNDVLLAARDGGMYFDSSTDVNVTNNYIDGRNLAVSEDPGKRLDFGIKMSLGTTRAQVRENYVTHLAQPACYMNDGLSATVTFAGNSCVP